MPFITGTLSKLKDSSSFTGSAFLLFGDFLAGDVIPFNQLALLGGYKKMRGYYEGRLITHYSYNHTIQNQKKCNIRNA